MMNYCTPEAAGVSSCHILDFYRALDHYKLATHGVILARGDKILSECYYAPFDANFKHRLYSVSKSFVSIAIGFCAQDGLIDLDEPMMNYFREYVNENVDDKLLATTIREMLMMETAQDRQVPWFFSGTTDRTEVYFRKTSDRNGGTLYSYDSAGSYMLGVVVEKVTGKPFLDYLKDKVLREIGFSEDAYCIQAPGGHSFGDSGVMCTLRDLLLFARFVLNGGTYNGKRYLNEDYVRRATTPSVCNDYFGIGGHGAFGYGYQFWGAPRGCFAMLGMGTQVALCDPTHDFIMVINSDNQANGFHYEYLYEAIYHNVIDHLGEAMEEDTAAQERLRAYCDSAKLFSLTQAETPSFAQRIHGKTFLTEENRMQIKWFRLEFEGKKGRFTYENAQGEKSFVFGIGYNEFGKFPEEGYSDLIATYPAPGNYYDAAFSADWPEPQKLRIRVQIIDKYFGVLGIVFGFKNDRVVSVRMHKVAEAFLEEYHGIMNATAKESEEQE